MDKLDVLVLGGGLAGTTTALCLQAQGLDVAVIDKGTHPRFAIGESTTTPSSLWLKLLSHRYGVPELANLAVAANLVSAVGPMSGVKKNFGFVGHAPGDPNPTCASQAPVPRQSDEEIGRGIRGEMHYFRQDVDAYLWNVCVARGVRCLPGTTADDLTFSPDGVTVRLSSGPDLFGKVVVDATGYRSVLAEKFGLRDNGCRTRSRALFTHMIGVRPYDEVWQGPEPGTRWHEGTLHHFFPGGWMWVIPFGNHDARVNPLCSVGVNFDIDVWGDRHPDPQQEWSAFLDRFPSIAPQFERARPVRPWVSTPRLQYTSSRASGDNFWLTGHAYGTVDALYSKGNINTFQSIALGVQLTLDAFETGDFSRAAFAPLDEVCRRMIQVQDRLVHFNYKMTHSPETLSHGHLLWLCAESARIQRPLEALVAYAYSGDRDDLGFYDAQPEEILGGFFGFDGSTEKGLGQLEAFSDLVEGRSPEELASPAFLDTLTALWGHVSETYGVDMLNLRNFLKETFEIRHLDRLGLTATMALNIIPRERIYPKAWS